MERKKWGILFITIGCFFIVCSIGLTLLPTENSSKKLQTNTKKDDYDEEAFIREDDTNVEESNAEHSIEKEDTDEVTLDQFDKVTLFHYDEVEKNVLKEVQEHSYGYYFITCEDKRNPNEMNPNFQSTVKEIKADSFPKIIEKLKSSERYESNITFSFFCPKYYYEIGKKKDDHVEEKVFSLFYGTDPKILLVGYQNIGYAFYFKEDVSGFLESLQ